MNCTLTPQFLYQSSKWKFDFIIYWFKSNFLNYFLYIYIYIWIKTENFTGLNKVLLVLGRRTWTKFYWSWAEGPEQSFTGLGPEDLTKVLLVLGRRNWTKFYWSWDGRPEQSFTGFGPEDRCSLWGPLSLPHIKCPQYEYKHSSVNEHLRYLFLTFKVFISNI